MGVIRTLDAQLSNMIAAGEVIERPAAIVKELVENALDAQARHIEVTMVQGGLEALEVLDDGCGMDFNDARLAFERHSTSKIYEREDLFAPKHLGFRGEALPSIASVTRLSLQTSHQGEGSFVQIAYGEILAHERRDFPDGSRFWIEGLFAKTPARLKYLKQPSSEAFAIIQLMERFVLSRPDVAFTLKTEEKTLINSPGTGQILDAVASVYGNQLARQAEVFTASDYDFRLDGCWVHPQTHRSSPKAIHVCINQRMVRSYGLQQAILEAFQAYIPAHRYPVCVLNIQVDPRLVDVNVHPSKWEVRISKESALKELITHQLQFALKQLMRPTEASRVLNAFNVTEDLELMESSLSYETLEVQKLDLDRLQPQFPALDLIGQMHGRYIVASNEEALYLIDQHAAKERINYEWILRHLNTSNQQPLLLPVLIEVSPSFMEKFEAFKSACADVLIELEAFAHNSYLVRSVPLWMNDLNIEMLMQDLQSLFLDGTKLNEKDLRDEVIANLACHRSVRFNQVLTKDEMQHILSELAMCEQPYHCPHGRPTLVQLAADRLWRDFER